MPVGTGKAICVSLAHIMLGAFMFVCGAVQVILQMKYLWLDSFYAGIWVGIWVRYSESSRSIYTISSSQTCREILKNPHCENRVLKYSLNSHTCT